MTLSGNTSRFISSALLLACAVVSVSAFAQAGFVSGIAGVVTATTAGGETVALKNGDTFQPGTTFDTIEGSRLVLKFTDGEVVALGPNSTFRVAAYVYIPTNIAASRSDITLLGGSMRLVTGAIGTNNPAGMQIHVGTNTSASVSGTGGVDMLLGVETTGGVERGTVVVNAGEISMRTPGQTISSITAGQYAPWQPGTISTVGPASAAPATMQSFIASLNSIQIPNNQPIVNLAAAALIAALPATAAGTPNPPAPESFPPVVISTTFTPQSTPAPGGGCIGSSC